VLAQDRKQLPGSKPSARQAKDDSAKAANEGGKSRLLNPESITWGDARAGLKVGIGYRPGDRHFARPGESVTFVVYLQNVGDKATTVSHTESLFDEFLPTVLDEKGEKQNTLTGPIHLGDVPIIRRSVSPGEVIRLGFPWFVIREPEWNEEAPGPTLLARPGKYRVRYEALGLRLNENDHDDAPWSTGPGVELEVRSELEQKKP
jgi:hypothetical protein